jgi:hypothetical protein
MHTEGIVSKRTDAPYTPGNRELWRKGQMPQPGGILSWSAEASRKREGLIWVRCCLAITIRGDRRFPFPNVPAFSGVYLRDAGKRI